MKLNIKLSILLVTFYQLLSFSAIANPVEYVDNRWYETQEEAEAISDADEINDFVIYDKKDYPEVYAKIESTLENVYNEAKKNLGPYYKNFPRKPLFILNDRDLHGGIRIGDSLRSTNILYVSIKTAKNEGRKGVIAHELSHYILDHGKEDREKPIETVKHIFTTPDIDSVICSTVKGYGVEIAPDLKDILEYFLSSSALIEEDTQGVPFDIKYESTLLERLMTRSILEKSNEKKSCKEAVNLRDTIVVDIYIKYCSYKGLQECRIPDDIKLKLPNMISEFKSKAMSCLDGEEEYFYSIVKEVVGEDAYQMLRNSFEKNDYSSFSNPEMTKAQTKLFFNSKNPIEKLIGINEIEQDYLLSRIDDLKLDIRNLRFITSEDEADMLAQVILMDESDTKNSFAVSRLQYMSESEKSYCKSKVDNNIMPNYGFLSDIHHSQCWRYWRSVKLKEELKDSSMKDLLVKTLLSENLQKSVTK